LEIFVEQFNIVNQKKSFIEFASDNNVLYNKSEFEKDSNYIFQRVKAYIARDIWGNNGWYGVMLNVDKQFQKAIELFDNELTENKVKLENE
jgi:carboxyl-terminal processing protease